MITEAEFNALRIAALIYFTDEIVQVRGGLISTTVEIINGERWVIMGHPEHGEIGRIKAKHLLQAK